MVDFTKRVSSTRTQRPTNPIELYETLDRLHDKGPLRPAQLSVLEEWHSKRKHDRDVLIKLHTGQGKTLIGLLALQSQLNDKKGPAVYLCPDNFLIEQTREQARQFGIATCRADPELPDDFLSGDKILVTSVQKLFNGLTKFGLNHKSIAIGTFLMDDAHACADTIREACRIRIPHEDAAYNALLTLFTSDLEQQGIGTFADIANEKRDALLPVPYWSWQRHVENVAAILSAGTDRKPIKFAWPLIKNSLQHCQCVVSGSAIEIEPYLPSIDAFGSYASASHRIFMSATVTDDAFLIKGLRLKPETITAPLTYSGEKWSGEKMIIIPSLIDEDLDRELIVSTFGASQKRTSGLVGLTPGFAWTKDWERYGAIVASPETVSKTIENLKAGNYGNAVVLANRYNGIDLPDESCRILIFDSKPHSENLIDLHEESCRPKSVTTLMRTVRTVEQGMGRSVRGEKDYSVIIITGSDITRLVRDRESRTFLSSQMSTQVEIGLEISGFARDEIEQGKRPIDALSQLIRQCLGRDSGWKAFYSEKMEEVRPKGANAEALLLYTKELEAELHHSTGDNEKAVAAIQALLDSGNLPDSEKGWHLQSMARFLFNTDRLRSQTLQVSAHRSNRLVLKPDQGVTVTKLTIISQGRSERIIDWLQNYAGYSEMEIALSEILGRLTFGAKADHFEHALDELSRALGFAGERPDKEWKEGPDNLWALDSKTYIIWECKNEVGVDRADINKREAEQMNRSSAWFLKHYPGLSAKRIIIHPANKEASAASFLHEVEVMRVAELKKLLKNVRNFFKSLQPLDFADLSVNHIQKNLDAHGLSIPSLLKDYSKKIKPLI